jgi:hypothetical protein
MKKLFMKVSLIRNFSWLTLVVLAFLAGSVSNNSAKASVAQKVLVETPSVKIITANQKVLEFRLAYDQNQTSGLPFVQVNAYVDGVYVGTPDRFKASGDRIAEDEPGVDPTFFITDENGKITNG